MSHSMDEGYLGVVVVYYERKGNILWNVREHSLECQTEWIRVIEVYR